MVRGGIMHNERPMFTLSDTSLAIPRSIYSRSDTPLLDTAVVLYGVVYYPALSTYLVQC